MIGMEASSSYSSRFDDEERGLRALLDAFGSSFTLDEIASAYCQAGRDPDLAGELLFKKPGSSSLLPAVDKDNNGEPHGTEWSSVSSHEGDENDIENDNLRPMNPKVHPVSAGSVSSIIGKGYVKVSRPKNGFTEPSKPMKLDSNEFPESEIWGDVNSTLKRNDSVHRNMEEFLFSMLGDGFKLDKDVIREVLDACGYDMPKSMEKLFDLSTEALNKNRNSICGSSDKFVESSSKSEVPAFQRKAITHSQCNEETTSRSKLKLSTDQKRKNDLERTVLTALFQDERKCRFELPKKRLTTVKKSTGIFGPVVSKPHCDSIVEPEITSVDLRQQAEHNKEEERYQATRKAAKEYRVLMKEYYQSAIEAYSKGDSVRAKKLEEQGHFFLEKAHKADEESSEMILETKNEKAEDSVVLDLHGCAPKEAIRLLKCHLSSFSGISFKYMKVILETNDEDTSKGSRRNLVMKLLNRESIKWVEEENGGTILIQLDCIDRKRLSFVKK